MVQVTETIDQVNHAGDGSAGGAENQIFGLKVELSPDDAVFE